MNEFKFFFLKKKLKIKDLFKKIDLNKNFLVNDIKPLYKADRLDISFLNSLKYKSEAIKTKAGACITTSHLKQFLPNNVEKIIVKNVLYELALVLKKIYLNADIDFPDFSLKVAKKNQYRSVKFCNNVLIGGKVKIR